MWLSKSPRVSAFALLCLYCFMFLRENFLLVQDITKKKMSFFFLSRGFIECHKFLLVTINEKKKRAKIIFKLFKSQDDYFHELWLDRQLWKYILHKHTLVGGQQNHASETFVMTIIFFYFWNAHA